MKSDNIPSHNHDINISATGSTDVGGEHQHDSGLGESIGYATPPFGYSNRRGNNQIGGEESDYNNSGYLTSWAGRHSHTINFRVVGKSLSYGNSRPFDLAMPYIGVYMWERIG